LYFLITMKGRKKRQKNKNKKKEITFDILGS